MVRIYGHPFAAFYWKALIALYERDVPFEFLMIDAEHPENTEAVSHLAPTGQFPVLVDGDRIVIESAAIIEYLDLHHGDAPPMVPADPLAAIEARQMDGVFDDYVSAPLSRMVLNALRYEDKRDPYVGAEAKATLDKSYAWLNCWMGEREWAANDVFGIADCAAAPALLLRPLGVPDPKVSHCASGLSRASARSPVNRTGRRRGEAVARELPTQGAYSGLTLGKAFTEFGFSPTETRIHWLRH
jgi:glutathione S-transferase